MTRRPLLDNVPDCPKCGVSSCPDDDGALWDTKKQGRWLRGVKFMRADPTLNRTEFICMECGCTFSELGLPKDWSKLELLAQRPEPVEQQRAESTRLEYDDDPEIPEEMLGDMREAPADLAETTTIPSVAEEMQKLAEAHPEILEKAMPMKEQVRRAVLAAQHLIKS